jgi:hypothetical protein
VCKANRSFLSFISLVQLVGRNAVCRVPNLNGAIGFDGYAIAGGSVSGGILLDPKTGQAGMSGALAVGLGAYFSGGPNIGGGPSNDAGVSLNLAVNGGGGFNTPLGGVGGQLGYNILGTDGGEFSGGGGSFTRLGVGTPGGYGSVGANFAFTTPSLYNFCD